MWPTYRSSPLEQKINKTMWKCWRAPEGDTLRVYGRSDFVEGWTRRKWKLIHNSLQVSEDNCGKVLIILYYIFRASLQCIRTMPCDYALCSMFAPGDRHIILGTKVKSYFVCLFGILCHFNTFYGRISVVGPPNQLSRISYQ